MSFVSSYSEIADIITVTDLLLSLRVSECRSATGVAVVLGGVPHMDSADIGENGR